MPHFDARTSKLVPARNQRQNHRDALHQATTPRDARKASNLATDEKTIWTALRLHCDDNVATALRDLPVGTMPNIPDCDAPRLQGDITRGHKFALTDIAAGKYAIKYGQAVGVALSDIAPGEHVHLHNIEGLAGRAERHRSAS